MTRWGATPEDWLNLSLCLGLTADLAPVVSNTQAEVAEGSSLKALGKVPSRYNKDRKVVGIADWTRKHSSPAQVDHWAKEPDYGICLQTRTVRALDIDIDDREFAGRVAARFCELVGLTPPARTRANSGKALLAFRVASVVGTAGGPDGAVSGREAGFPKRSFRVDGGLVELLGDGQQFIAAGTHPSGVRYEWVGGLPDEFPEIAAEVFEAAWAALVAEFATAPANTGVVRQKGADLAGIEDPVAVWLSDRGLVLGQGRGGELYVECPWKHEHSSDSGITEAAWFPAGTNGYERGGFRCLHAHCDGRGASEFENAIGCTADDFEELGDGEGVAGGGDSRSELGVVGCGGGRPSLVRDKRGKVEPTLPNLADALRASDWCGWQFATDSFFEAVMVVGPGESAWRPMKDTDAIALREWLERGTSRFGEFKPINPKNLADAILKVAEDNRFDSAKQWINSLTWDRVPRVETFLTDQFGAEDTPYHRAVARYWWTGHAARVLDPGHKCDMVPILISPEGRYKSSSLQSLGPTPEAYIEVDLNNKDDDLSRKMRGALLGEIEELRGLRGRSAEANKAWVTRRVEKWTPKYRENSVLLPRRLMFVGTTNDGQFLDNSTGSRRWLPVVVGSASTPDKLAAVRDQLWAEARERFKVIGEVDWRGAYELAEDNRGEHVIEDAWQSRVADWLDGDSATELGYTAGVTISAIFELALGRSADRINRSDQDRMADVLRALNYTNVVRKVRGRNKRVWVEVAWLVCTGIGNR